MLMKKILLLFLVLFCTISTWAMQRSTGEALEIARSFFAQYPATRSVDDIRLVAVSGDLLKSASTRSVSDEAAFYVYNHGQSAYVIVSGDDRMKPVLGYSDRGAFITDNLPPNMQSWLESYSAVYTALSDGKQIIKEPRLLTRAVFPEAVAPMLDDINWNQDTPYNNACPLVQGSRCMTGCVATAMAMILKYHSFPVKGKGSYSYKTSSGLECSFDYGNTTFSWDEMLPQYVNGNYTAEQANAVAELMYACGVAVDMEYSPSSSGAYSFKVGQALIDYFGYDENLGYVYRDYFTSEEWLNMIKTELSKGRPVLYNGASKDVGHEFVFDGYDTQDMVHVNWGWGGSNNGYFEVISLDPSSPGIGGGTNLGGGFIYQQGMLIGLEPPTTSSSYISHFYLSKLEVNKKEVLKEESFDLTITEMYNMSTTFKNGQLGLIAEKNGKQSVLWNISIGSVKTNYGFKEQTFSNLTISKDLADGTYALYMATKDARESSWSRVRGGYGSESRFTLTVVGNTCTLTPFTGNLMLQEDLDGSVEALHNLYSGRKGDFRMLLSNKNETSEFYGLAGVLFITTADEPQIISLTGYTQLELKPGTNDREVIISGDLVSNLTETSTDIPAGDYYICPGVQWGEYVYGIGDNLVTVTVDKAYGSPNLVVANARLEKNQLQVGEKLRLLADLSLSGTGNVYDKTLMAAIFTVGQSSTSNLHYAEVFIEKGQSQNFVMEIDPVVGEGRYTINLYKPDLLGNYDGNSPVCSLAFAIGPVTAIENETVDKEGIVVYGQPVKDILRIYSSEEASYIRIYNLSGQMVLHKALNDTVGNEYSISVEGMEAGYYIVALQSINGKVYRSKFIKK